MDRLCKDTIFYSFVVMVGPFFAFILTPIMAHYLGPDNFGRVAIIESILRVLYPFLSFVFALICVDYYQLTNEPFKKSLSTSFVVLAIVTGCFMLVFTVLSSYQASFFGVSSKVIIILPFIVFGQVLYEMWLNILRVMRRVSWYFIFSIFVALCGLIASLFFIVTLNLGYFGRVYGLLVCYGLTTVFVLIALRKAKLLVIVFDIKSMLNNLKIGSPLILHSLAVSLMVMIDRFFIEKWVGINMVGIYSVGFMIANVIMFIQLGFNLAWQPYFFSKLSNLNKEDKRKIVGIAYLLAMGLIICVVILYSISPYILQHFFSAEYAASRQYVLWISSAFVLNGLYSFCANFVFYKKQTKLLSGVSITACTVNILLNIVLVPRIGALGSAYATVASMFVLLVGAWILAQCSFLLPWFKPKFL